MKLSTMMLAFAATGSALSFSALKDLTDGLDEVFDQGMGDIIKKALCSVPCLEQASEQITCDKKNLAQLACSSIDTLQKKSSACVAKCGVDESIQGARSMCANQANKLNDGKKKKAVVF